MNNIKFWLTDCVHYERNIFFSFVERNSINYHTKGNEAAETTENAKRKLIDRRVHIIDSIKTNSWKSKWKTKKKKHLQIIRTCLAYVQLNIVVEKRWKNI